MKVILSTVPVFQFLSPDAKHKLEIIAKIVEKDCGDAVLMRGETVLGIYVVAQGTVGVYPPGAAHPLATLTAGASFGEMSFLEKTKASATIRAEEQDTKLILLLQNDLTALIKGETDIGHALFRGMAVTLSQKLRATTNRVAQELQRSRELLAEFSGETSVDSSPALDLPAEIMRQSTHITSSLDESLEIIKELHTKMPQKLGPLTELQHKLQKTKNDCIKFYPRLSHHGVVIMDFIKSVEEFIAFSSREEI